MLETLSYIHHLMDPTIIMVLVLGSLGGIFIGAIPGISPTMAVALMVPMTFYMDPATGLILLGVIYCCTVTGGAVTAILINVPGAPANIATILDGHPMAKQGRALEAMYITFNVSLLGGLLGIIVLITVAPALSEFAMRFGPSERFWVTIFGISVIVGLSSGSIVKGLFSGLFGMLISCIGFSPMLGEPRYVFHDVLLSGLAIVPVLVGMFAIPQVLELTENLRKLSSPAWKKKVADIVAGSGKQKGVYWSTVTRIPSWWKALLPGGIFGVVLGICPGSGANVAALVAYDYAKKLSNDPASFGKGNPAGVVAAESANSATVGPALIPLLTLGVPGSPTAAALLGGLLIHGLFPGPDLFTKHAEVTHIFMIGLLVAQFLMLGAGLLLANMFQHAMKIPTAIMLTAVSVLAVVGAYGVQNSLDDVYIMLGLGFITYFGAKNGFPAAPAVLGVVLGPIAEENFLRGRLIASTDVGMFNYFFTGTINIVLVSICVASIAWGVYMEWRHYKFTKAMEAKEAVS